MELFNGDRLLQNDGVFPDQLTPFPELLYHHDELSPAPAIHSPDEAEVYPLRCHSLQPQKLRPIRCAVRSPPHAGALAGYQSTIECLSGPGEGSAKQPSCEGRVAEDESTQSTCSSSDDADDSLLGTRDRDSRKRKRRTERKLQFFIENLMTKVMDRQEQMHRQLMEMMERRERERLSREEAWQCEEMERMKRNDELRSQETSRSLALISFIEKMLSQDISRAEPLNMFRPEERQGETRPNEGPSHDSVNKRWPEGEVQALISLRTAVDRKFHASGSKDSVWKEISTGMSRMGYKRSARKCKEKWDRSMAKGKKGPENSKTCPYFQELDILYKNGIVNSGNVPEGTDHEGEQNLGSTKEFESDMDGLDNL